MARSLIERAVAALGPERLYATLTGRQRNALIYEWAAWARPEQLLPPSIPKPWRVWLILAGRGWGKTRVGAETVRQWVRESPYVNLIGPTADDARDVMVEGESGILSVCPPSERPRYLRSDRKLIWPNGATSLIFTADEPERLRGKQHEKIWADELGAWRYEEAWTQATLGWRLGANPQALITTTPRPTDLIRRLVGEPTTHLTTGTSYENRANLAAAFFDEIVKQYEGTRLGEQELRGRLLEALEGALWTHALIEAGRVRHVFRNELHRVVVAVDPAGSAKKTADEAGIVVCGLGRCMCTGALAIHSFVLEDLSGRYSPEDMGRTAIAAYHRWQADRLVAEDNFGGQIVADLIKLIDPRVAYKAVHASRGKIVRAEPVAAVYEQHRCHHVGILPKLEDQLTHHTPASTQSPGRLDALVWGVTELMLSGADWKGAADNTSNGARRSALVGADSDDNYDDDFT